MSTQIEEKSSSSTEVDQEFEIEQYVHALGTSSTHVRFVMLAIIIAIIASATTLWSSQRESWERARINKFYDEFTKAEANDLWHSSYIYDPGCCPIVIKEKSPTLLYKLVSLSWIEEAASKTATPPTFSSKIYNLILNNLLTAEERKKLADDYNERSKSKEVKSYRGLAVKDSCEVLSYFKGRGITSREEAVEYGEKLYEAYINNMLYIHVPILGTIFDVNDLGLITGVTFFILMLVMSFYTHRAHENLAVCMWKVSEIAEKEKCFDVPGGKPNLLYHALAMQQVFTIPPTLARWRDNWIFQKSHYILFILPFVTEFTVTRNDLITADIGASYSAAQTRLSLQIQLVLLGMVLFFCLLCISHLYADDALWKRTFLHINPAHRFKDKTRWVYWAHLAENITPGWGLIVKNDTIFVSDTVRNSIWRFNKDRIVYHEQCFYKGLYLKNGEISQYSLKTSNIPKFRKRIWWFQLWKSPLSWVREPSKLPSIQEEVVGLSGFGEQLNVWERKLEKKLSAGPLEWSLGGAQQQLDGTGDEVGFLDIRSIIPVGRCLFLTDGALLRKIDERGVVDSWGGRPLAQAIRREPPLLLGLHFIGDQEITPEREYRVDNDFKPEILVCDFSTRRIFAVNVNAAAEAYKSKWGWTPTGVFVDEKYIYLLEYRRGFVWNELATFWQTINYPLGLLLRLRSYARVLRFSDKSFSSSPEIIFKMSPIKARRAKNEKRKALADKREPQGIRNYNWPPRPSLLVCYKLVRLYLKMRT